MFSRNRRDRDDRRKSPTFVSGRASRKEYWSGVCLGLLACLALSHLGRSSSGILGMMFLWQIRRAHDFGSSFWWPALAQISPLALLALPIWPPLAWTLIGLAAMFVTILLGLIPGDVEANRFGAPPPPWRKSRPRTGLSHGPGTEARP